MGVHRCNVTLVRNMHSSVGEQVETLCRRRRLAVLNVPIGICDGERLKGIWQVLLEGVVECLKPLLGGTLGLLVGMFYLQTLFSLPIQHLLIRYFFSFYGSAGDLIIVWYPSQQCVIGRRWCLLIGAL